MSADLDTLAPHPRAAADPALQVEVEDLPRWRRRLRLVVPPERVRRERQRLTADYSRRVRIPGFRPGKAPADLVRKRFRAEIEEELVRSLLRSAVREAIEGRGLEPIAPPEVRALDLDPDDTLRATAEVEVRPQIALARYRGFRVERPAAEVAPDAVERVLARLREEHAELRPVDRPAAQGDVVVADVKPLHAEGREVQGYELLLGSGAAPQVEAQLEGARAGDERVVVVEELERESGSGAGAESPPGGAAGSEEGPALSDPATAGGERRFRVELREIKERMLPELNDAFAASVSGAGSLAELRDRIADNLRREAGARQESELRERLVDAIAEANPIELPESIVTRAVERMLRPGPGDEEHGGPAGHAHPGGHGRHAEGDPQRGWTDREAEIAEILRPVAERSLRRLLILDAVARVEGLEASDEQIDAYVRERLESGTTVEEARRSLDRTGRLEELRHHLRTENVFEFLKSQSTIRDAGEGSPGEPGR